MGREGVRYVNVSLVGPLPLKPMLLLRKPPYGPERNQLLVPQSIMPVGYWPLRVRLGLLWSSNVIVRVELLETVGTGVAVGGGAEGEVGVAVGVLVGGGGGGPEELNEA